MTHNSAVFDCHQSINPKIAFRLKSYLQDTGRLKILVYADGRQKELLHNWLAQTLRLPSLANLLKRRSANAPQLW